MFEISQEASADFPLYKLKIDQAYLNITSTLPKNTWLYLLSSDCVSCPHKKFRKILAHESIVEKISVKDDLNWLVTTSNYGPYAYDNTTSLCSIKPRDLGHLGIYNLTISNSGCNFEVIREPSNTFLSIILAVFVCAIFFILFKCSQRIYERVVINSNESSAENTVVDENNELSERRVTQRLSSLDTFRGLAIVAMIFANCGSGKYIWFDHVTWNGIHPADFIFPSFLWIMGVCIPISIKSQITKNISIDTILSNIAIRSFKLFFIGLFIHTNYGPNIEDIRVMGVLQRFGVAYFFTATFYVLLGEPIRSEQWQNETRKWRLNLYDIITLIPQWLIMFIFVSVYLLVVFLLPVPDCPTAYLGPGGIQEGGKFNNCIGGAAGFIDRLLLGKSHLYQRPRAGSVYEEKTPFDPEGPFGCLLTIVQVFLGVQCGQILLSFDNWKHRIIRWLSWSVVTLLIGLSLCGFSINDGWIPINKNLWSLSFVLVTTSFAFALLTLFYFVIDVKKWWTGKPLLYAGMNAIIMYVGSELFHSMYPFYWRYAGMNTHFEYLLSNIWTSFAWNYVAFILYKKNIFISL